MQGLRGAVALGLVLGIVSGLGLIKVYKEVVLPPKYGPVLHGEECKNPVKLPYKFGKWIEQRIWAYDNIPGACFEDRLSDRRGGWDGIR